MEADQQQHSHRCKLCFKSFSSGRSLGGHMRSHVHSGTSEPKLMVNRKAEASSRLGYDLRENPKKTFRHSDFIGEDGEDCWEHCKQCGKAFPSSKAVFGHMRCHSEKTCRQRFEGEDEEEEEKSSMESFADDNEISKGLLLPVPKRKRRSKRASPAIGTTTGSSSSLLCYEPEQEDVAISLMMLSRAVSEFSDKNSWVLDEEEEEDESVDEIPISGLVSKKKALINGFNVLGSRFQCVTCKKSFLTYHALGGHRANQKRSKSCCAQNSVLEHQPATGRETRLHECVFCGKIFSSGQALGGHKRSHLVPNCGGDDHQITAEVQNQVIATTVDVSEPIDLNFPAPGDELSSNLKAWWAGVRGI